MLSLRTFAVTAHVKTYPGKALFEWLRSYDKKCFDFARSHTRENDASSLYACSCDTCMQSFPFILSAFSVAYLKVNFQVLTATLWTFPNGKRLIVFYLPLICHRMTWLVLPDMETLALFHWRLLWTTRSGLRMMQMLPRLRRTWLSCTLWIKTWTFAHLELQGLGLATLLKG